MPGRMTRDRARDIAARFSIPLGEDFHALRTSQVDAVTAAADEYRYRKPKAANGSRARYFFYFLARASRRPE